MRKLLIIVGTLLLAISLVLGACAPAPTPRPFPPPPSESPAPTLALTPMPAPETPIKTGIATTLAEIGELVEIGMTRSAVNELINKSYFEFVAIQLSEFSNIDGQIKMVPRETDDPNPATHILHLYLSGELHPAYVVYSMLGQGNNRSSGWEVIAKGRMPPENAVWLIQQKSYAPAPSPAQAPPATPPPAPAPSPAPTPAPIASEISREDMIEIFKANAMAEWGNDFEMVKYVVDSQTEAYDWVVKQTKYPEIIERAKSEWQNDYEMVKYTYENQVEAYEWIMRQTAYPDIMERAKQEWGEDYEMVKYEYENQVEAYKALQ